MAHFFVEGTAQISMWIEADTAEAAEADYELACEHLTLLGTPGADVEDINEVEATSVEERE